MDFILHNVGWVIVWVASAILLAWPEIQNLLGQRNAVSTLQATQLINQRHALVIDLRGATEFATAHIPGARHIPGDELAAQGGEIGRFKSRPVVLVTTGKNPAPATKALRDLGFTDIFVLQGGLAAWVEANLPVERTPAKA